MDMPLYKTKIVATIGPASESPAMLRRLLLAGVNVCRLNFSHGDFASHAERIKQIRAAEAQTGRTVAIMADLPGPKIRIGLLAEEIIELRDGQSLCLTTDDVIGTAQRISVNFAALPRVVKPGDSISLNDGYVQLAVTGISGNDVQCLVSVGGALRSSKGLNLPGIELGISAFTDHDRACLEFALSQGVDAVSQSFVECAADIEAVRAAARARGAEPFIIAKIERARAVARLDEIIAAADGIMIARGDLGVELPIERIAVTQKDIMRRCRLRSKPVITATQMLESMTTHRLPTRAEATDVANAILDGTDCVMLSGESATGRFPEEAVLMLGKIAATVEPTRQFLGARELFDSKRWTGAVPPEFIIALSVEETIEYVRPAAVVAPTVSGATAVRLSVFRLPVWVVAVSPCRNTCRRLQFCYGVRPVHEPHYPTEWNEYVRALITPVSGGPDFVMLTEGPSTVRPQANHRLEIIRLAGALV